MDELKEFIGKFETKSIYLHENGYDSKHTDKEELSLNNFDELIEWCKYLNQLQKYKIYLSNDINVFIYKKKIAFIKKGFISFALLDLDDIQSYQKYLKYDNDRPFCIFNKSLIYLFSRADLLFWENFIPEIKLEGSMKYIQIIENIIWNDRSFPIKYKDGFRDVVDIDIHINQCGCEIGNCYRILKDDYYAGIDFKSGDAFVITSIHPYKISRLIENPNIPLKKGIDKNETLQILTYEQSDGNNEYTGTLTDEECNHSQLKGINDIISIEDSQNKIKKESTKMKKFDMKNMFGGMEIGQDNSGAFAIGMNGKISVKTDNGYVSYDTDKNVATELMDLVIDIPIFKIPMSIKDVKIGDIVIVDSITYTVIGKLQNNLKVYNFNTSKEEIIIPKTNMFLGTTFVVKVVSMFENQNGANIFSNPMAMMMFMGKDNDSKSNGFDMNTLMMMSMFNGGKNPFENMFGNNLDKKTD